MADDLIKDRWRLVRGANLKSEDRHCLLTLFLFAGENGEVFSKQETLAEEIGVHPRSVRRSLKRLNDAGIVRSEWKTRHGAAMRHYSIDFETLKTVQRTKGRTPASCLESPESRTPASAMVGHERPGTQDNSVLQEDPMKIHGRSKSERTSKTKFQKPTTAQVAQYATERNSSNFDAEHFCDYYESNGWRVGRNAMEDWRATVRRWLKSGGTRSNGKSSGNTEAEQAWQNSLDSLKRCSRFRPEEIKADVGEFVWPIIDRIGLKRIDEANDYERRELKARFIQAFSGQGAAV